MTKLKPDMEVVYVEDYLVDKAKVISIDKEKQTARLSNGIVLNREILKKGYFKRAGIRSEAKAYLYEKGSEGYDIYQAYVNKNQLRVLTPNITQAINQKDILSQTDRTWLEEFTNLITKYLQS